MTAITVKHTWEVAVLPEFGVLLKRLQAIPALFFLEDTDVQVEPIQTSSKILQAVIDNEGFLKEATPSSVVVDVIQIHELSKETNDLVAAAALHTIWATLPRAAVGNPNTFVIQNGTRTWGWAEGDVLRGRAMNVVRIVDAYRGRRLTRGRAGERLRVVLTNN